jgi:hypothetical protein
VTWEILRRQRRARHLSMASYAIVLLSIVAVLALAPWPLSFAAFPMGLLLLKLSDVVYERALRKIKTRPM